MDHLKDLNPDETTFNTMVITLSQTINGKNYVNKTTVKKCFEYCSINIHGGDSTKEWWISAGCGKTTEGLAVFEIVKGHSLIDACKELIIKWGKKLHNESVQDSTIQAYGNLSKPGLKAVEGTVQGGYTEYKIIN